MTSSSLKIISYLIIAAIIVLALCLFWFQPFEHTKANSVLAITCIILALWTLDIIPAFLTALIFFTVIMLLDIAPPHVTFAGFTSSALWIVFSGLVLSSAIDHTGLQQRIAYFLGQYLKHASYAQLISGIVFSGMILSFFIPSALGRIVLIMPIILSLAQKFGFSPKTRGYTGIVLATGCGVFFPAFSILPANIANIVWLGAIENLYPNAVPTYADYLLLHFPILGLFKAIIIILCITYLYHDHPQPITPPLEEVPMSSVTPQMYLLIGVLLCGLTLWTTDFLHHIPPAWIALTMAIVCLHPMSKLLPRNVFQHGLDLRPFFYIAGIISLGVVANYTGLGQIFIQSVLHLLPINQEQPYTNITILFLMALLIGIFLTLPAIPVVLTPLSLELATATHLPLETILMTQVLGFSTVLFPYQSPPLVIALQLANLSIRQGMMICLLLSLITVLILLPLDLFFWNLSGWIP